MLETKLLSIRHEDNIRPVMVTRLVSSLTAENEILWAHPSGAVAMVLLNFHEWCYLPEQWGKGPLQDAHRRIAESWDELRTGDTIDMRLVKPREVK